MTQEERSSRSRALVLEAALGLFSRQGYRATSMRDIAARAGLSTGNVYHHFKDKDAIFRELIDRYSQAASDPEFPINRALRVGGFPDNLEAIGHAARESVAAWRPYVALILVDVVEFEGSHVRQFYAEMARRFERFLADHRDEIGLEGRLRPGLSPAAAVMLTFRTFQQYFTVETLFGVPEQYGRHSDEVVREIADILRHGMLRRDSDPVPGPRA